MSQSSKKLKRAFKLIKQEKTEEALDLLRPLTKSDADNPHVWWLFAYAATEPREARDALIKVLRLDPNYANAPKARDMLDRLNEEYPPEPDELARYPELQTVSTDTFADDVFSADPFSEPAFSDTEEAPYEDVFGAPDFGQPDFDEPFEDLSQGVFDEPDNLTGPPPTFPEDLDTRGEEEVSFSDFDFSGEGEGLDEEALAGLEEQTGQRSGRGKRLRFYAIVILILLVAALLLVLGLSGGEEGEQDPGPLQPIEAEIEFDPVMLAARTHSGLVNREGRVVLAEVDAQIVLFVEACSEPKADQLSTLAKQGMLAAARQTASDQNTLASSDVQLDAFGVTLNLCNAAEHDTLYRAVVPLDEAAPYLEAALDADQIQWAEFQQIWETQ